MEEKQFWALINDMQDQDEPFEWLTHHLSNMADDEIADYEHHFQNMFTKSYTSNLWGAAYLIMGGCSDDLFDYFRGWLIAQGQEVFEATLQNPEFLAEYIPDFYEEEEIMPELEDMLDIGLNAFTLKKTGDTEWDDDLWDQFDDLLKKKGFVRTQPEIEFDWEDEDDLMERFPKLWERFGENPLGC